MSINVNFRLSKGGVKPFKKHITDAGYDITASSGPEIKGVLVTSEDGEVYQSIDYIQYKTGLFVSNQELSVLRFDLRPRSSISKYWLDLANSPATIDNDYRGEILIRFRYNWQFSDLVYRDSPSGYNFPYGYKVNSDKIYKKGDQICQLLAGDIQEINWTEVTHLDDLTDRGTGAFGSTTK